MKDRTKHDEFLEKLASLMEEYNAEITAAYYEGCGCCGGGEHEITIETGGGGSGIPFTESTSHSRYLYPGNVRGMMNE